MPFENYGTGVYGPYYVSGAPVAGTNEVQTVTFGGTITGGTFTLALGVHATAAITHTGAAMAGAAMVTAINNAITAVVGASQIVASAGTFAAGVGTILITFSGTNYTKRDVAMLTAGNSLTGTAPTIAIAETTPGVGTTGVGAAKGALLVDVLNALTYQNSGTAASPTWTKVGLQS